MSLKRLEKDDFLVSTQSVSQTVWSSNQPSLFNFKTLVQQKNSPSGKYYLSVYSKLDDQSGDPQIMRIGGGDEVQFDIAYAHAQGLGATPYNEAYSNKTPTSALYGQYRTLLMEDENAKFNFGGGLIPASEHFYAISISRARFKEKLLPGSFNLTLMTTEPDVNGYHNEGQELTLTDNSGESGGPEYFGTQRVYKIIKGKNGNYDPLDPNKGLTSVGSYGWFLPDIGTILLNADALSLTYINGGIGLSSVPVDGITNNERFYKRIFNKNPVGVFGSGSIPLGTPPFKGFTLNSEETISSDYIFIHARNSEFNYSENPSFIKGDNGEIYHEISINNPQVYPTTVGLYNDSNDLIGVAKLSRPLLKDFTKELLLRIKIDF